MPWRSRLDPPHQALASSKWCGIASAEHKVALMWTERDRLILNFCDKRQCSGFRAPVLIDADDTLLGFGCLRDSCLIAARDPKGATRVHLVNQLGKVQWSRPLTTARDASVTIVGAGDRSFAVATRGDADATVHRFTRDGASTLLWERRGAEAPSLAWSAGKLMVGYRHDRNVVTEVLAVPR
jgi:hypothetical protein